ncbi:MAG: VOC family protein [Granulosicoccus sp.]
MELDHVFVILQADLVRQAYVEPLDSLLATRNAAKDCANLLSDLGFSEGSNNRHPGQGTANHRFFFNNFMLEFLFVEDVEGLVAEQAQKLALQDRFTETAVSPIGVASRRSSALKSAADYAYGVYQAPYLPAELEIHVALNPDRLEPLWFHLPFVSGLQESDKRPDQEPRSHANGARELTSLTVEMPFAPSACSFDIAEKLGVKLKQGDRHAAHLEFDGGRQGQRLPLPPSLPLTLAL